jgi:hypothetical protein
MLIRTKQEIENIFNELPEYQQTKFTIFSLRLTVTCWLLVNLMFHGLYMLIKPYFPYFFVVSLTTQLFAVFMQMHQFLWLKTYKFNG